MPKDMAPGGRKHKCGAFATECTDTEAVVCGGEPHTLSPTHPVRGSERTCQAAVGFAGSTLA